MEKKGRREIIQGLWDVLSGGQGVLVEKATKGMTIRTEQLGRNSSRLRDLNLL